MRCATLRRLCRYLLLNVVIFVAGAATTFGQAARDTSARGGTTSLGQVGLKLANPLGGVWALFTENDLFAYDGDISLGNDEVGNRVIFEPILPIPLYGSGEKKWMLITRPIVPVLVTQPVPRGLNRFDHLGGLGDTQWPIVVKPPLGRFMLAVGPTWLIPTATRHEFGRSQWGVGPAVVLGYAAKTFTGGIFPQYHWGVFGRNHRGIPRASNGSILMWLTIDLKNAWTVGLAQNTVTYDYKAKPGNRWNLPIGPHIGKTTELGKLKVNFRLGGGYSVVHQDVFGQKWLVMFDVIPVIPPLIKKPILGGTKRDVSTNERENRN